MTEKLSIHNSQPKQVDVFLFALFLATALHLLIILGVSFQKSRVSDQQKVMEFTLVTAANNQVVKSAHFLAQKAHKGVGKAKPDVQPQLEASKKIRFRPKKNHPLSC